MNLPRSEWVLQCLNIRLEPSSCSSVSLESEWVRPHLLRQIEQLEQAQDVSYDYNLFFLFVNLKFSEQLDQNNTQWLSFTVEIASMDTWAQYQANMYTGNNACWLSTPLLLCSRLSDDCTIQSVWSLLCSMCSAGFCLSGFFSWKQVAFISARAWYSSRSCSHLHSSH